MKKINLANYKTLNLNKTWLVKPNNVIKFKSSSKSYLSDNDLVSILLGIIKMIREDERNKVIEQLKKSIK